MRRPEDETKDAIHDHDEIREGIRRAAAAEAGSDEWWAGIDDAREANDEHLAEDERDDLPDFLSVLSIFALVTLSSYSVMPQPQIARPASPR